MKQGKREEYIESDKYVKHLYDGTYLSFGPFAFELSFFLMVF